MGIVLGTLYVKRDPVKRKSLFFKQISAILKRKQRIAVRESIVSLILNVSPSHALVTPAVDSRTVPLTRPLLSVSVKESGAQTLNNAVTLRSMEIEDALQANVATVLSVLLQL